nr:NADH dehydrogenase subunit 2 [Hylurgus micklitzi]
MLFFKYIFYPLLILSSIISISASSWMMAWMGLEMNLLSMIPLMKNNKSFSTESLIKYFMVQTISSMILLFSLITLPNLENFVMMFNYETPMNLIMMSTLMMKMGAAPFHIWLPEVISGLNWNITYLMLTWQKLAPMILLMNIKLNMMLMINIILMSSMIGSIMSFNQICLKKLLTFSSINHMSWLLAALLNSLSNWIIYFLIYCIINLNIIIFLNKYNITHTYQLTKMFSMNKQLKMLFMMNFMSLGGLPPFLGFIPKWLTINQLINNNYYFITLFFIINSLLTLYVYLRLSFSSWIILTSEMNLLKNKSINYFTISNMFMLMFSLLMYPIIFIMN